MEVILNSSIFNLHFIIVCRLLTIQSKTAFSIEPHLKKFADIAKNSKEYQGHGWGCAYLDGQAGWKFYKNINPIWEDDISRFSKTTLLAAHARSARFVPPCKKIT